jgi:hypothetical protein
MIDDFQVKAVQTVIWVRRGEGGMGRVPKMSLKTKY